MELSIIIVNWNSREYLGKCIASILENTHGIGFEIVVIDNASFDGSREMILERYPQVRFIQGDTNLGFAKANNTAFHRSCGRNVLFLNPDTEIVGPAVTLLFEYLQKLPNAGTVGCKLLNADGTIQTSCILPFPTILNQTLDSEVLRVFWPTSSLWGNAPLFGAQDGPGEVEAISGACVMLKRSVFEKVGFFSEEYFMYAEDIDLCYKVRQAGCKNYYVPDATIVHYGGGSTQNRQSDFSVVTMRKSTWWFLRKTRGNIYGLTYRISTLISAVGRMAILVIFLPLLIIRHGGKSWNSSFRKWRAILAWSLGVESLIRNHP